MVKPITVLSMVALLITIAAAQQEVTQVPTSVQTEMLLDAAGSRQREAIKNIYLVECPASSAAGTGFALENGFIVTNAHVVGSCDETNLVALTPESQTIRFKKVIKDNGRDLAVLMPAMPVPFGLKLASGKEPPPGTEVSTWGYPFLYDGATPLLSVGHVAGYRTDTSNGRPTNHIVVNAAFNHGNSGGPLFLAQENSVIGVVVMTFHFYPPYIRQAIDKMSEQKAGFQWEATKPDGTKVTFSESQVTAMILDEFYKKTQIMIGEAICASELTAMLKEHKQDLEAK